MKLISFFTLCLALTTTCFGQQSITSAIERQFNKIESDILTTAEAMPEDEPGLILDRARLAETEKNPRAGSREVDRQRVEPSETTQYELISKM